MLIDLHLHSTASDGMLEPEQVVHSAAEHGVGAMALTDHDSLKGLARARQAAQEAGIPFLHGIELSVGGDQEIHLLGYGVSMDSSALTAFCQEKERERAERIEQMISLLQGMGIDITLAQVRALSSGVLSRSHIARVLLDKGAVTSVKAAFEKYLNPGRPAYVPRRPISVGKACSMLISEGAVPILAHPYLLKVGGSTLFSLLEEWQEQGLAGVEVYHPSHQANHVVQLERFARAHKLLVTGGSDFHGEGMRPTPIAQGVERWRSAVTDTQLLFEKIGPQGRCGMFRM